MKRPAFQFYPADWRSNANLRRCSEAARGAWMDIICVLHDSEDEYGLVRWPLAELARAAGVALRLARELADKKVIKGADGRHDGYAHMPRHAGKDGIPVVLVEPGDGPVWYSSRMVRDEWRRGAQGASTRFTADNQADTEDIPKSKPSRQPTLRLGDGSSTSSSTSSSLRSDISRPNGKEHVPRKCEPPGFPEFYAAFPRKTSRGAAVKAYQSALSRAQPADLLAGAKRYAAQRGGQDAQFTKHPATWLNQDCWLDEDASRQQPAPAIENATAEGWWNRWRAVHEKRCEWQPTWGPEYGAPGCLIPAQVQAHIEKYIAKKQVVSA